jgi:hypothetical protein
VQEEQHDDGFRRGIGVIGSRVYVREQTCNIQCFLHHCITHFAICFADLSESGRGRCVCLCGSVENDTGLGPGGLPSLLRVCAGIHVTVTKQCLSPTTSRWLYGRSLHAVEITVSLFCQSMCSLGGHSAITVMTVLLPVVGHVPRPRGRVRRLPVEAR